VAHVENVSVMGRLRIAPRRPCKLSSEPLKKYQDKRLTHAEEPWANAPRAWLFAEASCSRAISVDP